MATKTLEQRVQVLEDREAIIRLKAQYVNYNDGGWHGGTHAYPREVSEMFVEDGIWDGRPNAGYAQGREQILKLFQSFAVMPFIIHYVSNPLIDVDGDVATGHWHALVPSTTPDKIALWVIGLYKERYVRTPEGWKFHTLRFETAANTLYELGWGRQQFAFGEAGFGDITALPRS